MDGILNVNKPSGITSYDVIRHIKRILAVERMATNKPLNRLKIGHAGTLDPFAEGVLLLLLGRSTKQSFSLMGSPKIYEGIITLGTQTDTDDCTGRATAIVPVPHLCVDDARSAAQAFIGEIDQVPPAYSALHWGGRRLYDLARAGVALEIPSRKVHVYEFEILNFF
ncbi:MAG: tRNA pseudouridine(55) synthase TruB, partial [Elusimicrobiota bacterium]